jgi:oligopeptide transport system substrate-binding protein
VHRAGLLRAAGITVVASLLAGCSAATPPDGDVSRTPSSGVTIVPERGGGTVRVGLGRDPVSLDPRHVADDEGEFVVRALFDGLVDLAPDGSIIGASALSWSVEDDGLTYRFLLRDDRFHDGSPVSADDHAAALLGVVDPERAPFFREDLLQAVRGVTVPPPVAPAADEGTDDGARAGFGTPDDVLAAGGIEVVGPRELVLRLARPDPLLLHRLVDPVLVPLPRLALLDPDRFALEPIGNGPFRMLGPREPGTFIRLVADPGHQRAPRVDGLVLQVYATDRERSQRWDDLLAGRLQITAIPAARRADARERFGLPGAGGWGSGLHEAPLAAVYAYGFAIDVPPFDDVLLRQAISAAIDRAGIAAELDEAGVQAADAILPPTLGGVAADCPHCRHDPDLATRLITEWRASRPAETIEPVLTVNYPRGGGHVVVAERVAADIERTLGLDVRLQSRDLGGLVRAIEAGDAPFFRYGLRSALGGEAAAIGLLDPAFRPGASGNWVRWSDPMTALGLDELAMNRDPELAREIEQVLLDSATVVPLLWTRPDIVAHPDVAGFRLDPTGRWWPELVRLR